MNIGIEKQKLWTKEFIVISTINFLATLIFFLLMVTIASFAKTEYGVSTSTAGLVSSIFIIGSLIGRLGAGRFIGEMGTQKVLWVGLIAVIVAGVFYLGVFNTTTLILNRLFHGIAFGVLGTAAGTVIAQILPASRKGEGIGYYSLSAILATAIGPFVGILLMKLENGFTIIFWTNIVLSVLSMLFLAIVKINLAPPTKTKEATESSSLLAKFIEPKAVPISLVALVIGFSYSGVMSYLSFYAEEINLVSAASYFFLVYAIVIIFSRPVTGKLMDTRGANVIVYPCLAVFAVGMFLFSEATAGWMLLLAAAFIGFGYGNFNSIAQTVAVKVTEPHRFGLATSTYFILYDLGLGLGPYFLGFIVPYSGYRSIFFAMVIVILASIPMYYFAHGKKEKIQMKSSIKATR